MANIKLKRYVWLINLIQSRGPIKENEISEMWYRSGLNEMRQKKIPHRTLYNHIDAIRDIFGVEIRCSRRSGFYIDEEGEAGEGLMKWMLSLMNLSNNLSEYKAISDRILLEAMPKGQELLVKILDAMKESRSISITYRTYYWTDDVTFKVEPYCVKLFKQRWYLLAYNPFRQAMRLYGLDRIKAVELTDETFKLPKDFSAEAVFADSFGIILGGGKPEKVIIKANESRAKYLRALPLHPSQEERPLEDGSSEFSWRIADTFDFRQELLSYGNEIEVLEPQSLREGISGILEDAASKYRG